MRANVEKVLEREQKISELDLRAGSTFLFENNALKKRRLSIVCSSWFNLVAKRREKVAFYIFPSFGL